MHSPEAYHNRYSTNPFHDSDCNPQNHMKTRLNSETTSLHSHTDIAHQRFQDIEDIQDIHISGMASLLPVLCVSLRRVLTAWLSGSIHGHFDGAVVRGHLWRPSEHGDGQSEALPCAQHMSTIKTLFH